MPQKGKRAAKRDAHPGREKWSNRRRKSRRELGQNFLKDKRVAKWIVAESGVGKGDLVVELGAGGGMLTRQLARAARRGGGGGGDADLVMPLGSGKGRGGER